MANKDDLRIAVVEQLLKDAGTAVMKAIDDADKLADQLTDAQDGETTLAWSRTLFGTADTGPATLTVTASTGVISCIAGANLFSRFRPGRNVQITNFTTGAINQTTEILAATDDSITIDNTGLVDETDPNARCQENTTSAEQTRVTTSITARDRLPEFKAALDNGAVATANRRDDLNDIIW